MPPNRDHETSSLHKRVSELEAESAVHAERYASIDKMLGRIATALSGDPDNDILGVIGRMKLQDQTIATLNAKFTALELEWMAVKQQAVGAGKVGKVLWAFVGAGGLALVWKAFQVFNG